MSSVPTIVNFDLELFYQSKCKLYSSISTLQEETESKPFSKKIFTFSFGFFVFNKIVEVGVFPASYRDFPLSCWTFPLWGFSYSRRIYIRHFFSLLVRLHLVLLLFVSVYVCCSSFPIKNSHQTHLHFRYNVKDCFRNVD